MKPFATLADAPKIARQFVLNLIDDIGAGKIPLVVYRNSKESDPNVCHSQDFCDANMTMDSAFSDCGFACGSDAFDGTKTDEEIEAIYDRISPVWNAAWALAKAAEFDHSRIDDK
ncbi:MAG: hypothetical protein RIS35_3764 [Pseudomonadota bacterium]|jgi:hypothetical protein